MKIPVPKDGYPEATAEWALVFGGASSVGKAGIQIFKSLGYKVIVTASSRSTEASHLESRRSFC